jgi:glycosyltransferase involved in cell wall biosynthesis
VAGLSPLISIVVPAFNEAECLDKLHQELRRVLDPLPYRFEFLVVDDGSSDTTVALLHALRARDPRVCFLSLSRNFGHQAALSAGLDHARGDAVIMMDGDLQHPPEVIPNLIERWRAGFDVVNTVRLHTTDISTPKRFLSAGFYWLFNKVGSIRIEPGAADFRLMSRAAVSALNHLPEKQRFLRGLVPWIGFRQTQVAFTAPERFAGGTKYTFARNLRFALDGMTAFNFYPLRRPTVAGWLLALASVCLGLVALAATLFGRAVPGWTWAILCVTFFSGCQLVVLGVLGEYLGRVLEQVKDRPLYVIQRAVGFDRRPTEVQPDGDTFMPDTVGPPPRSRDAA